MNLLMQGYDDLDAAASQRMTDTVESIYFGFIEIGISHLTCPRCRVEMTSFAHVSKDLPDTPWQHAKGWRCQSCDGHLYVAWSE